MERVKIIIVLCVFLNLECFGFRLKEKIRKIRSLEELGSRLEKHPYIEVSSGVYNRILYGRSIFIPTNCPYGTVRIGQDCIPRPNTEYDYEYDG